MKNRAEQSNNIDRGYRGRQAARAVALATGLAISASACGSVPSPFDNKTAEEKYASRLLQSRIDDSSPTALAGRAFIPRGAKIYTTFDNPHSADVVDALSEHTALSLTRPMIAVSAGKIWFGFVDPRHPLPKDPSDSAAATSLVWVDGTNVNQVTCTTPPDIKVDFEDGGLTGDWTLEPGPFKPLPIAKSSPAGDSTAWNRDTDKVFCKIYPYPEILELG